MTFTTVKRMAQKTARRAPYVSLILTALALVIHFSHPLRLRLLYTRTALADGEFWRAVTCHLVHLNHGARFYELLDRVCPDHERTMVWLRDHQEELLF